MQDTSPASGTASACLPSPESQEALLDRKRKQSDPLSEYSEFLQDDCYSDISELFGKTGTPSLQADFADFPGGCR